MPVDRDKIVKSRPEQFTRFPGLILLEFDDGLIDHP